MSDRPKLPTEENLKKLPLRAIVAYAVRCARRVQPLFGRGAGIVNFCGHEAAVEQAMAVAERFCLASDANVRATARAATRDAADAADAAYAASARIAYYTAKAAAAAADAAAYAADVAAYPIYAAYAADAAARAAAATADASAADAADAGAVAEDARNALISADYARAKFDGDDDIEAKAAAYAVARDAATAAAAAACAARAAAWADYDRLLELDLGTYPRPPRLIDATGKGPLGPLWPDKVPQGSTENHANTPP